MTRYEPTDLESGTFRVRAAGYDGSSCDFQRRVFYEAKIADGRRCELLTPRHADALQCLAGNPLLFLGTSVTRYQYLSLVHFIDRGMWPDRCTSQRPQFWLVWQLAFHCRAGVARARFPLLVEGVI